MCAVAGVWYEKLPLATTANTRIAAFRRTDSSGHIAMVSAKNWSSDLVRTLRS